MVDYLIHVETVREQILEMLQKDEVIQNHVMKEVIQRLGSDYDRMSQDGKNEAICMTQLIVYNNILGDVV